MNKNKEKIKAFLENPRQALLSNNNLDNKKVLFGICAKEKSLKHALILLAYYNSQHFTIDNDIINIIMNLLASGNLYPNLDPKTQKLVTLLEDLKDYPKEEEQLWSQTISEFMNSLIASATPDERVYTLAIRFYCTVDNSYEEAQKVYELFKKSKITPHNRTFIPLIMKSNYDDLAKWHQQLDHYHTCDISIEVYEMIFQRFSELWADDDSILLFKYRKVMNVFNAYRNYNLFITPKIANIFKKLFKIRTDLRIANNGFVYLNVSSGTSSYQMPEFKLESHDVSYKQKRQFAKQIVALPNKCPSEPGSEPETYEYALSQFECHVQRNYIAWDVVIDGANVALFNNSDVFRTDRIISVLNWTLSHNLRALVILHCSRRVNTESLINFINKNSKTMSIYWTPVHHNDDHFSLYAALTRDTFILTDDEMGDHAFTLSLSKSPSSQGNADFIKWKERHQIFFKFKPTNKGILAENLEIQMPRKFSHVIQVDNDSKTIYAPIYDPTVNPPQYLENLDLILDWIIFSYD